MANKFKPIASYYDYFAYQELLWETEAKLATDPITDPELEEDLLSLQALLDIWECRQEIRQQMKEGIDRKLFENWGPEKRN
ncbi:MAG: hypothetical protein GY751_15365 [Bacteroidetes bacterium]|nr:hypothetical protein [Bacteroidota bacterium]